MMMKGVRVLLTSKEIDDAMIMLYRKLYGTMFGGVCHFLLHMMRRMRRLEKL